MCIRSQTVVTAAAAVEVTVIPPPPHPPHPLSPHLHATKPTITPTNPSLCASLGPDPTEVPSSKPEPPPPAVVDHVVVAEVVPMVHVVAMLMHVNVDMGPTELNLKQFDRLDQNDSGVVRMRDRNLIYLKKKIWKCLI